MYPCVVDRHANGMYAQDTQFEKLVFSIWLQPVKDVSLFLSLTVQSRMWHLRTADDKGMQPITVPIAHACWVEHCSLQTPSLHGDPLCMLSLLA